jgi:hypothetical protein
VERPSIVRQRAQSKGVNMSFQTSCVKVRLKDGSLERVREWAKTLNETRRSEAVATLRDETVVLEAAFLDHTSDGDFLIYVMTAESFERSAEAAKRSTHDIDIYHRQFKREVWERREELECLVDLERISELIGGVS